jgi:hypothetical protein
VEPPGWVSVRDGMAIAVALLVRFLICRGK